MAHPHRIREIAAQAGLSAATVDRALHGRPGVRPSTVREVQQAVADLDRQAAQVRLAGRTVPVDVVVQAPPRFSAAVRAAVESQLPALRPAVVRARFSLHDGAATTALVARLDRIAARGSAGVLLKAPDAPEVHGAVERLVARGVPVVTLVTDLPATRRSAHVGVDDRAAGATAAYLLGQWLGDRPGDVLVVRGRGSYRGEDERAAGFTTALRGAGPQRRLVEVVDDEERGDAVFEGTLAALRRHPRVQAVYSLYAGAGGNGAVVAAFERARRPCAVFLAHDLDGENAVLLQRRHLSAVLHHDLRADARRACRVVLQAQGLLPGPVRSVPSTIQVVTPHNVPSGFTSPV